MKYENTLSKRYLEHFIFVPTVLQNVASNK